MAKVTAAAFVLGIITLICACVVVPQHTHATLGIQRLHEFLGRSSAGFFAFGMLCGCWCAWKGPHSKLGAAWLFWSWLLLTAGPLIGLFCSETLLLLTKLEPRGRNRSATRCAIPSSGTWVIGNGPARRVSFSFFARQSFLFPRKLKERRPRAPRSDWEPASSKTIQ